MLSGTDPAPLKAARVIAALAEVAYETPAIERGLLLASPSPWSPDVDAMTTLVDALRDFPLAQPVTLDDLFSRISTEQVGGSPVERQLRPMPPNVSPVTAADYEAAAQHLHAFESVVGRDDPAAVAGEHALTTALSTAITPERARAQLEVVDRSVTSFTNAVTVSAKRITLTSRRSQVPLTFDNKLKRTVRVRVHLESTKLLFPLGDEPVIDLRPGNTTLRDEKFTVEARTSGTFPMDDLADVRGQPAAVRVARPRHRPVGGLRRLRGGAHRRRPRVPRAVVGQPPPPTLARRRRRSARRPDVSAHDGRGAGRPRPLERRGRGRHAAVARHRAAAGRRARVGARRRRASPTRTTSRTRRRTSCTSCSLGGVLDGDARADLRRQIARARRPLDVRGLHGHADRRSPASRSLAMLCTPLIARLFSIDSTGAERAAQLHVVIVLILCFLPQMVFYGFTALATALLNAHRRFVAAAFAPVFNNVVVIGVLARVRGRAPRTTAPRGPTSRASATTLGLLLLLGLGTTAGIVAMALVARARGAAHARPPALRLRVARRGRPHDAAPLGLDVRLRRDQPGRAAVRARAREDGLDAATSPRTSTRSRSTSLPHGLLAVSIMTTMTPELAQPRRRARPARPAPRLRARSALPRRAHAARVGAVRRARAADGRRAHDRQVQRARRARHRRHAAAVRDQPRRRSRCTCTRCARSTRCRTRARRSWSTASRTRSTSVSRVVLFPSLGVQGLALAWSVAYFVAAARRARSCCAAGSDRAIDARRRRCDGSGRPRVGRARDRRGPARGRDRRTTRAARRSSPPSSAAAAGGARLPRCPGAHAVRGARRARRDAAPARHARSPTCHHEGGAGVEPPPWPPIPMSPSARGGHHARSHRHRQRLRSSRSRL